LTAGPAIRLLGPDSLLRYASIGELVLFIDVENDLRGSIPALLHTGIEWTRQGLPVSIRLGTNQQMRDNAAETLFTFGCRISFADGQFDAAANSGSNTGSGIFSVFYSPFEFRSEKEASKIPYLKIYSPADKASTSEQSVMVSGETDKQRLSINGVDVYVKEDGTFNALVPLYIGKNLIQIAASNEGYRTIAKRHIRRTAKVTVKQAGELEKKKVAIKTEQDSILQRELAIAAKESDPGLSAKEKKKIETEKAALDQKKEAVKEKLDTVARRENYIKQETQKIETLATLGVIEEKKTKDFDAEERITRAELAMWLVKARSLYSPAVSADLYPDVPAAYWAARYISAAVKKGFMQPYPDGLFHPEDPISEKDGVNILKKFDSIR
jgi:hypothetical protein